MILSGLEIARQIELGTIQIDPFDPVRLNPNSYNLPNLLSYHFGRLCSLRKRQVPK